MTPQTLRESIFMRAFEGKLVEQCSNEGTAEDTLKGTKTKAIQAVEECIDIPETWRWTYLVDLAEILYGFPFNSEKFNESHIGMPIIRIRDINNGYSNTYSDEPCDERYRIVTGDMLVGMDGNFQVAFWSSEDAWLNQRVCKITSNPTVLIQKYLYYYLPIILKEINGTVSYSTVKHLSAKILNQMLIPLPPLAEQKRIVAKIEELLPLIDRYEQAWSKLEDFNKRFPVDMQKSILQMAIQGKLVEQRPEEGTGEELYQQIQAEKRRLIKAGEIKKEKPLPEIAEEEIPFEIPESWKWCRLSELTFLENGDRSSKYPVDTDYVNFGIPFFGAKDMSGRYMSFENVRYISETKFKELGNGKLHDNDFICLLRGSVGKISQFKIDENHKTGFICAQMVIIRSVSSTVVDYLYTVMTSPYYFSFIESKTTGTAVRQLPAKELGNILIPLPPLAEQKRIVAKLEEILPLCERLK